MALEDIKRLGRPTELGLAFGLLGVLLLFVVPLPAWALDFGLALSISFFGATVFNTQRVIFGRLRRPPPPVLPASQIPPPQPPDPPAS